MPWDARLILGGQPADVFGQANTVADFFNKQQLAATQQAHEQRTLADLATQQRRGTALRDLLTQAGPAPQAQLAALQANPQFFPEAMNLESHIADVGAKKASEASAKASEANAIEQARSRGMDNMVRHFAGVVDDADYQRRLAKWPEASRQMMWKTWDEARPQIEGMAAQVAARGPVIVGEDGTQYRLGTGNVGTTIRDENKNPIKARPKGSGGGGRGGGAGIDLTPEALDAMAQKFLAQGELPALGSGAAGLALRVKIMNRALELQPGRDLAGAKSDYAANMASLKKLLTQADAVDAFEATAEKNLDTFMELSKKLVDTGSPFLNTRAREWDENVAGNPDMAGISAARATAVNEIGKVLSGATGGGAITEGARKEVDELMKKGATIAQLRSAAEVLKRDMHARKKSVAEQIDTIRSRISGKPAAAEAATPGGATASLHAGEVLMLDKKGQPHAVSEKDVQDAEAHGWKRR